jgi:hypothetical protein
VHHPFGEFHLLLQWILPFTDQWAAWAHTGGSHHAQSKSIQPEQKFLKDIIYVL